jgi:DNA helicase-2/ATP-dependent DNA helicase PcrA
MKIKMHSFLQIMFLKIRTRSRTKKDATPEGMAKVQNIEELLNGIKDFTEGQKEIDGARGASEFMEDVALATDLDKDTSDEDRVALMTIHLAKGLEFPHVLLWEWKKTCFQAP